MNFCHWCEQEGHRLNEVLKPAQVSFLLGAALKELSNLVEMQAQSHAALKDYPDIVADGLSSALRLFSAIPEKYRDQLLGFYDEGFPNLHLRSEWEHPCKQQETIQ